MKFSPKYLLLAASGIAGPATAELSFNGFIFIKSGMTNDSEEAIYGYDGKINFKSECLAGPASQRRLG